MENSQLTILNRQRFIRYQLDDSAAMKKNIFDACAVSISDAVDTIIKAVKANGKILICGNGGSAADAQHFATELVIRMTKSDRPALPAIALTTDTSMLTAAGNDIGFVNVFARQIEALGNPGDVLVAISTSGRSENIGRAVTEAKKRNLTVIGFLGKDGGTIKKSVDIPIFIPSNDTQRIQEGHITVAHIICGIIENEMFG